MRADRRSNEVLLGEREAALQAGQAVLEIGQVLARHQVDGGEPREGLEPLVSHQRALALVLVHAQSGPGVHGEIGLHVGLLEVGEQVPGLLAESAGRALGRVRHLREHRVPGRLHPFHPFVVRGQHRLGGGEIGGHRAQVAHQLLQGLDLREGLQAVVVTLHLVGVIAEVLELAGRGVGLEGFQEGLGLVEPVAQLGCFLLGEQVPAPERQAALQALLDQDQLLHHLGDGFLELLDRLFLALGDELRHARREPEQLEECLEGGQVPVFGSLDVLEVGQLVDARRSQLRQPGGVELLAGNREHQVTGVDQRGQDHDSPFGLQAVALVRREVLDAVDLLDQLRAVDHLAMPLLLEDVQDVRGVLGAVRIEPLAIEELQGVEHGGRLLGAILSGDDAQGVLCRLLAVLARDEHREVGILGRLVLKVCGQDDAGDGVYQVTEVDPLVGSEPGQLADGLALGPFHQRLGASLVGHLEGIGHVLEKPAHQVPQDPLGLGLVGGLCVAARGGREIQRRGVVRQRGPKLFACLPRRSALRRRQVRGQAKEHFIGLLLVLEVRRIERLDEVEVEITGRHGCRALVGSAEEEISLSCRLVLQPFQLVLPDLVAGDVGLVGALHDLFQGIVVVAVELGGIEALGALLDERVEVVGLLEIQVELPVVRVGGDELAADRLVDFAQDRFHLGKEVVGRVSAQVLDAGLVETERVAQLFGRGAQGCVDVSGRQPVDRERVDDAERHGLVRRPGEGLCDTGLQHLAAIDHRLDVRNGAEGGILAQVRPVAVVGDETGPVLRHLLVEQLLAGPRQGLEHLALLHRRDALEGVDVVGMNRKEADELVHPLVHVAVELGERCEVFADLGLLLTGLLEQTLGDDELHVLAGDEDLFEAVLDPANAVGHEGETGAVEDGLLHACHEAEAQVLADLAHLTEEVEVEDQLLVLTGTEIVQQLIHDQEQAMVRIGLVERGHHLLEGPLVVGDLAGIREGVGHAHGGQVLLQLADEDVPQRHGGGPDLGADHLELAGDCSCCLCHLCVSQGGKQVRVLGDAGDHRHQV